MPKPPQEPKPAFNHDNLTDFDGLVAEMKKSEGVRVASDIEAEHPSEKVVRTPWVPGEWHYVGAVCHLSGRALLIRMEPRPGDVCAP